MTKKTPKTPEAKADRHDLVNKLLDERKKWNRDIAQNLLDNDMNTPDYRTNKFWEHEEIANMRAESHRVSIEKVKVKKQLEEMEKNNNQKEDQINELWDTLRRNSRDQMIGNFYLDDVVNKDPSKAKLVEAFKKVSENSWDKTILEEFYKEFIENCDDDMLNAFFVIANSDIFGYQFERDDREYIMKQYLKQLETKWRKFAYTSSFYDYRRPTSDFQGNYEKAIAIWTAIYKKSDEDKKHEDNLKEFEILKQDKEEIESKLRDKKQEIQSMNNDVSRLKWMTKFYLSLNPETLATLLDYEKKYGKSWLLKKLLENNPKFELKKFIDETSHEFISKCERSNMWPCTDWKHEIAIKIDDAPSINTWAWMQYGKNVSIWYDGQIQDKQYFKRRDGYSSNNDIPGNAFNKVVSITVNDESGVVEVIAQSHDRYPKTIIFKYEKSVKEDIIKEDIIKWDEKEKFDKKFENARKEILETHTRNATTPMIYNMRFRWDLVQWQDPYQQVPYEAAQVISKAIDYKRWLWAIVISAQIDASMGSGRQMEYVAYIIYPDGGKKKVRTDTIYADAMKNGKTVDIPEANKLIKEYFSKNNAA